MPKIKSAKKALIVSERRRKYNLEIKQRLKDLIKKVKKERKKEDLKTLISLLDKAASFGVIHKNKAARLKSRLTLKISKGERVFEAPKRVKKKKTKKRR